MATLLSWFIPKEEKFFNMLKRQSQNVFYSMGDFKEFIANFNNSSEESKAEFLERMKQHEHEGDEIAHFIIEKLNKTFISPIDREDIYSLTLLLDDIVDYMYTASKRMAVYKIKTANDSIKKFATIISDQVVEIDKAVANLKNFSQIQQKLIRINHFENEADDLLTKSLGELFDKEKDAKEIIKLKDIYILLETITDKGENVSNVMENIVVKHA